MYFGLISLYSTVEVDPFYDMETWGIFVLCLLLCSKHKCLHVEKCTQHPHTQNVLALFGFFRVQIVIMNMYLKKMIVFYCTINCTISSFIKQKNVIISVVKLLFYSGHCILSVCIPSPKKCKLHSHFPQGRREQTTS